MWGSRDGYIRDAQRKRFITESYSTPASRAVSGVGETTTLDEVLSPESGMNSVKNIVAREGGFSQNSIVRAPTHSPTLRVASGARLHGSYKKVFSVLFLCSLLRSLNLREDRALRCSVRLLP